MKHSIPHAAAPTTSSSPTLTIGLDLGDRHSQYCILDAAGRRVKEAKIATTREALMPFFHQETGSRIAFEVGGHSPWVSRLAKEQGLEVIVANARKVALITQNERKNDRTDAELLARIARADPELLSPIRHRSIECQADLAVQRSRNAAVAARAALINHVRGSIKSFGGRIPACSAESFSHKCVAHLPVELKPALLPIVLLIAQISSQIKGFNVQIERMADERYPETKALRQVTGVGALIALTFVLSLGDPNRVTHSRQVGPYLGLVPRTHDSGESSPQMRITKAGDGEMRRLLVLSANHIMGCFGPDCDLKRFGQAIAARSSKNARKRAKTAVARKLAVLLHHLWKTGEVYDPFYAAKRRGDPVPA